MFFETNHKQRHQSTLNLNLTHLYTFLNIISGEDIKEHRNNNNKTFILLNIKTHFNIKVPLLPKLVKDKG